MPIDPIEGGSEAAGSPARARPVHTEIAGAGFIFYSDQDWTELSIRKAMAHFVVDRAPGEAHEVFVTAGRGDFPRPPGGQPPLFEGRLADETPVSLFNLGGARRLVLVGPEVAIEIDYSLNRSLLRLRESGPSAGRVRPEAFAYIMPLVVHALSHKGLYVIHGAAVALGGVAALLMGESFAGKTTMSLALAKAGFSFMGDDLVVLDAARGKPEIRSLPFTPRVKTLPGQKEVVWDYAALSELDIIDKAELGAILHLDRFAGGNGLEPMHPAESLRRVLDQGSHVRYLADGRDWAEKASLCAASVPSFTWRTGPPEELDPRPIRELLGAKE